MKKFFTLSLLLIIGVQLLFAQASGTITGRVISKETKEVVPFATVALMSEYSSLLAGKMTSEEGRFTFEGLAKGKYTVLISFIAHRSYKAEILIGELNSHYDLGRIEIVSSSTEMEDATIKGTRSEINSQMDRKTLFLNNNPAHSGASVKEAMKALPGISFDQDGGVILKESDKVIVLINGKQSSLKGYVNQKGIANIPTTNIRSIDVINNPSAKYDPSGIAGIVNITIYEEKQHSFNGSVGLASGLGVIGKAKADLPTDLGSFYLTPKLMPSLDFNLKRERIRAYLQSEVLLQHEVANNEFTTRYYDDGRIIASQVPVNRKQARSIIKGGIDYLIDENNILSFSGNYVWESHTDSAQVPYLSMPSYSRNRIMSWKENGNSGFLNYAIGYKHKFKELGRSLSTQLQYTQGWEEETYYINDSSKIRTNGRDITSILGTEHKTSLSVDYIKPSRTGRFESGAKVQIRKLPVEYSEQRGENSILYPGLGSWTELGESIYTGYFKWIHEKKRYDIEAGIRPEYTMVSYDMDASNIYYSQNDSYDYFRLFPSVRASLKINQNNKFIAFYNQKVDRPGEQGLRIFTKSDDHEIIRVGNPYLRPQFTQSVQLGYKSGWKKGSVYLGAYFRSINDMYMNVYTRDKSRPEYDVVLKSYANTDKAINRGVEFAFNQQLFKFWKLSGNMSFYQIRISGYLGELLFPYENIYYVVGSVGNTYDANLVSTFDLSDNFQFNISGVYKAPKNIPLGKELERYSVDIEFVKKIWNSKAELTLAASDVFNKYGLRQEYYGDEFHALYENYYETQMIWVGFKYKF